MVIFHLLYKFLKINAANCDSMMKVWDAMKTITSEKPQISKGIVELETIYTKLQKQKLMIRKWRDLFITKRTVLITKLLGDHMSAYNSALSEMAGSIVVVDDFDKHKESHMPQMDPGTLDVSLSISEAKKYVDRFNKYMQSCYPGAYRFKDYINLLKVRLDQSYQVLIGDLKGYSTEQELKVGIEAAVNV